MGITSRGRDAHVHSRAITEEKNIVCISASQDKGACFYHKETTTKETGVLNLV